MNSGHIGTYSDDDRLEAPLKSVIEVQLIGNISGMFITFNKHIHINSNISVNQLMSILLLLLWFDANGIPNKYTCMWCRIAYINFIVSSTSHTNFACAFIHTHTLYIHVCHVNYYYSTVDCNTVRCLEFIYVLTESSSLLKTFAARSVPRKLGDVSVYS